MAESRDANDPRDAMRALRKEARAEFEDTEATDTGGQEHASRLDREGVGAARRPVEAATAGMDRTTLAQSDAGRERSPHGDPATGGGGNMTSGPTAPGPAEPKDK